MKNHDKTPSCRWQNHDPKHIREKPPSIYLNRVRSNHHVRPPHFYFSDFFSDLTWANYSIIVAWRRDPTGIMVISYKRNHYLNGFIFLRWFSFIQAYIAMIFPVSIQISSTFIPWSSIKSQIFPAEICHGKMAMVKPAVQGAAKWLMWGFWRFGVVPGWSWARRALAKAWVNGI